MQSQRFNDKNLTIMAQETLQSLLGVVLTLSPQEQEWFALKLNEKLDLQFEHTCPMTREQLLASAEEGMRQIKTGEYLTNEEVFKEEMNVAV